MSRSDDFTADARGPKVDPVELARGALIGLLASDRLTREDDDTGVGVAILRNDDEVARVHFVQDVEGGWLLDRAVLCAGLALVDQSTAISTPTPAPTTQLVPPDLLPGSFASTVVESVRVRSYPSVEGYSTKYSPLLPDHALLYVIAGPTSGSGYWWYQVQLLGGALSGGIVRGWVAAGDHDGTPWIAHTDVDGPNLPPDFTRSERALLSGVRPDIAGCVPLRKGQPAAATAALDCRPAGRDVKRVLIVGFADAGDALAAYLARVSAEGIPLRTHDGRCETQHSEGAYVPGDTGDNLTWNRSACFIDTAARARYLATEPPRVVIEVIGRDQDVLTTQDWAWRGNRDAPGDPTVWRDMDG